MLNLLFNKLPVYFISLINKTVTSTELYLYISVTLIK